MREHIHVLLLCLPMAMALPARAGTASAVSAPGPLDTRGPVLTPLAPIPGEALYGGETRTLSWTLAEGNPPADGTRLALVVSIEGTPVFADSLPLGPGPDYAYDLQVPNQFTLDCRWRLSLVDAFGNLGLGEGGPHPIVTDEVPADGAPPQVLRLEQNWPNPFNPSTRLRFGLPRAGRVRLSVHDVRGRQVALLFDGARDAGWFTAEWRPGDLASGVYFARLVQGETRLTRKLLLLK
ncbi:MAG: T9SS type A sorting domain-containing protein [Candidatus Krumholzibacteriia bacterium]|nr:T9SS type A sorting domain-containing protein [bacterium]MCB9513141.1 T9SS type A sorting domain-containing protein [Candidatus Latescibacterota bacterium]MCB9514605.1 T9SS type A sorting domain-containing protein [Candidatus Latescibacterota bacterium]